MIRDVKSGKEIELKVRVGKLQEDDYTGKDTSRIQICGLIVDEQNNKFKDFDLMGDEQKRYIECTLKTNKGVELRLINIYAPHGQSPELARL